MAWVTDKVSMETNMNGGLSKGIRRMFSGESLFMVTYTSQADNQSITFASAVPGNIITLDVSGKEFVCQKRAFLCAQPTANLETTIMKGVKAGLFGGEGLFLTTLTGPGKVYLQTITMSVFAKCMIPFLPNKISS